MTMIHLKTVFYEKYKGFLECRKLAPSLSRLQYLHHVSADLFAFFQKRKNFSILLLYTKDGKAFLQCDGLFRAFPICVLGEEKRLLEGIFSVQEKDTRASIGDGCKNYVQYLYDHAHLILLIDNTICHKTSAHTVCGSVYAIECDEKLFEKYQDYLLGFQSKKNNSSGMFVQIDTNLVQNKFVHAQKDLLERLYNVFLPQVVLHYQI